MSEFGAAHGLIGDAEFGTELPMMEIPEADLSEEKNAAKFSRTKEFTRLKQHLTERIAYYQTFLPNGEAVTSKDTNYAELGARWMTANSIIAELTTIIAAYEQAAEIVKADAARRQDS